MRISTFIPKLKITCEYSSIPLEEVEDGIYCINNSVYVSIKDDRLYIYDDEEHYIDNHVKDVLVRIYENVNGFELKVDVPSEDFVNGGVVKYKWFFRRNNMNRSYFMKPVEFLRDHSGWHSCSDIAYTCGIALNEVSGRVEDCKNVIKDRRTLASKRRLTYYKYEENV